MGWDEVCTSARANYSANGHTFNKNRANEDSPRAAHLPCLKMTGCRFAVAPSQDSVFTARHALLTCRKDSIWEQNCKLLVWGEAVKHSVLLKRI